MRLANPKANPEAAAALAAWQRLAKQMASPEVELTIEEFAAIWTAYRTLCRVRLPIDPMLRVLLDKLASEAFFSDDGYEDVDDERDATDADEAPPLAPTFPRIAAQTPPQDGPTLQAFDADEPLPLHVLTLYPEAQAGGAA